MGTNSVMSEGNQPVEAEAYFQQAYEKQQQGALEEAVVLYKKSLALYPTAEAHTFLGWTYSLAGRFDRAIAQCKEAIGVDPDYGNPYNDIGSYLIETDRHEEAVPWLEKAIAAKRYESYCYAHYNLGRVWEKQGNWFRALQSYNDALHDNPEYNLAKKASARVQGMLN